MSYRTAEARICTFCGRGREEVRKLVAGPQALICDRCVAVCRQLIAEERRGANPAPERNRPRDLKERLDQWVVGQERSKRVLAVAVYNHLKRVGYRARPGDLELQKSNILLIGPPGTGKTHLARTLARLIDVPFALCDATPLTQAGYVGEDVESVIVRLLRAADNDPVRAARGIIYLDEVDKLARRIGHDRDVSGEGVQQSLLKLLEGKRITVRVGADKSGLGDPVEVDTSGILFIGGGAFEGLRRSIEERRRPTSGFRADRSATSAEGPMAVLPEDLHKYGFIPEFVGRFPVLVTLDPLDEETLMQILSQPQNALLRQYQRLFAMEGARLDWTQDGLRAVAQAARARATGARGLRAVIEELLLDVMFDLPAERGGRYVIDEAAVRSGHPRKEPSRTAA
jgi:ATP-dependent Clp protease ATP-binding subunit ClpX